jgi:tetratricopeptide (TPR) repeat protein
MTYHLVAQVYQAAGGGGEPAAFDMLAAMSCLSGAAYLGVAAWSARRLAEEGASRILLYGLLIFFAPLQLFFGYAEVYAPLSVALLVFLTLLVLYQENRSSLLAVSIAWSVGLFFHLNALFLAPLLGAVLVRPPRAEKTTLVRRLLTVVLPILAVLVLACVIYAARGYSHARFQTDFGHVGKGAGILVPLTGPNGLLTGWHLKDTVNLFLLLAPVPLVLLIAGLSFRTGENKAGPVHHLLLAGSIWLAALLILVHMKLGAVRDWDLFAPHMSLLVLAGWYAVTPGRNGAGLSAGVTGPVVAVAVALAVPWFALNAGPDRSLARLEAVAADQSPYPLGLLHEQLAYHHQMAGNRDEVIRHYRKSGEVCPGNPRFHAIYGTYMLNLGDLDEAVAAYDRSVATDSTYVYGLKMAVLARVLNEDYASALAPARHLAHLGGEDAEAAAAHGTAAEQMGLRGEAIEAYRRAAAQDPSRLDLLERAAGLHLLGREFTAAEDIFTRLRKIDPARTSAALGLADAIWQDFLAGPDHRSPRENRARLGEVAALIDQVVAAGGRRGENVESLTAWRDEVRSRLADLAE